MQIENLTKKELNKQLNTIYRKFTLFDKKQKEPIIQQFQHILDKIPIGIIFFDEIGNIVNANSRAEVILGLKKKTIISRSYNDPEWKITDFKGNKFHDEKLPFQIVKTTKKPVIDLKYAIEW